MTGVASTLLAMMLQPLRELLDERESVEQLSIEDATSLKLKLTKACNELEEEIRRHRREEWEAK